MVYNEVQITDLLLGDIPAADARGIQSFEWKMGGVYKTGLALYRAYATGDAPVSIRDILDFKKRIHVHRNWMNRRIFAILSQSEIIRGRVVTEYREYRKESVALYREIREIFDTMLSGSNKPANAMAASILRIDQLLDQQSRRDKAFILPLLAALRDAAEPAPDDLADAA